MKSLIRSAVSISSDFFVKLAAIAILVYVLPLAAQSQKVSWMVSSQTVNEPVGTVSVIAQLSTIAATDVTIPYSVGGTTTFGEDHDLSSGTLVIPAGQLSSSFAFNVINDQTPEPTETISISMAGVTGAALGMPRDHLVEVVDNDLNRDTAGTEFYITFPGILYNPAIHSDPENAVFIVGNMDSSGSIAIPSLGFSTTFSVMEGSVTRVDLPSAARLRTIDTVEIDKATHIFSDNPITVYGLQYVESPLDPAEGHSDAFLAIPSQSLGISYHVSSAGGTGNQFAVAATEDNTTLSFVFPVDVRASDHFGLSKDFLAGATNTVTLDKGDTYQFLRIARGSTPSVLNIDITGTHVMADKAIAVFSGGICNQVPLGDNFCDYLVEQMTPVQAWGKSYQAIGIANRKGGVFRFVAGQDDTDVTVDDGTTTYVFGGKGKGKDYRPF